jgi:putative endonuclease
MFRRAESGSLIGGRQEQRAEQYLLSQGLRLIARNYRCRQGEIDLIMRDGDCLAFIEVRYRKNASFGSAAASVTISKQRRIVLTAQHYLQRHSNGGDCRFDVLAMTGSEHIEWLKNAFEAF